MKLRGAPVIVALALLGLRSAALSGAFDAATDPTFRKLLAANAGLGTYTAHITVHTRLRISSFTLHGTLKNRLRGCPSHREVDDRKPTGAPAAVGMGSELCDLGCCQRCPHDHLSLGSVDGRSRQLGRCRRAKRFWSGRAVCVVEQERSHDH